MTAAALLGSLLRPHARRIGVAVAVLLIRQAAQQTGPLLVAYAFDRAVPALRAHGHGPLVTGAARYRFVTASARVGQDVLADLRYRVFLHAQRLDLAFHERYTSGRLTSRATSDVEALRELLDGSVE